MSTFSHSRIPAFLAALAAAFFLAACASTAPEKSPESPAPEPVVEVEPWEGDGMEIPMDGSSMEAWNYSLARVKAHAEPSSYETLENAIDYLLLYDLRARNKMDLLIKRLDGLTGYEIVARVGWRKPAPGKGPAEKGAADAKIIDS